MKQLSATFLHSHKTYNIVCGKLPRKFAVIGMPHQRPAFSYLADTYRDDLSRLEDCNHYRAFPSLKQAIEFIEAPCGHKGYEASEALVDELVRFGVLEEVDEEYDR